MSGTLPTSPDFATVSVSSNSNTLVNRAHSGRVFTREFGGHLWIIDITYQNMIRDEFEPIYSLLLSQHGATNSFLVSLSHKNTPRGIATGTPLINGSSQTGNSLITDGWTASQTGILKAGDIMTIAGDTKVYEVTADANSDGGGNATFTIEPALIESPSDGVAITVTNVQYTVFVNDVLPYTIKSGFRYDLSTQLIEFY